MEEGWSEERKTAAVGSTQIQSESAFQVERSATEGCEEEQGVVNAATDWSEKRPKATPQGRALVGNALILWARKARHDYLASQRTPGTVGTITRGMYGMVIATSTSMPMRTPLMPGRKRTRNFPNAMPVFERGCRSGQSRVGSDRLL